MCTYIYTYKCNLTYSLHYLLLCLLLLYSFFPVHPTLIFISLFNYSPLHLTRLVCMSIGCLIKGSLPVATLKHIILFPNNH